MLRGAVSVRTVTRRRAYLPFFFAGLAAGFGAGFGAGLAAGFDFVGIFGSP